jgi:hypothetical protein
MLSPGDDLKDSNNLRTLLRTYRKEPLAVARENRILGLY